MAELLDRVDRCIVNALQQGFPLCERPYEAAGRELGLSEVELIARIEGLLARGVLTRFGPLYRIERGGGAISLAAMAVPGDEVDLVVTRINALEEVAHNYERAHPFNLWFVLATSSQEALQAAVERIERDTGYVVHLMPKEREYFLDLRLEA